VWEYASNAIGLYDMHGNVGEWCWDWWGSYTNSYKTDPTGAISGSDRVLRGGSFLHSGRQVRSAHRLSWIPSSKYNTFGFRVVRP